MGIFVDKARL